MGWFGCWKKSHSDSRGFCLFSLASQCNRYTHIKIGLPHSVIDIMFGVKWEFWKWESESKSMSVVNSGWSNYLLSLHSFQSECWAWLSEYNPLILFCSLIKKPENGQMRLDRCWKSRLIFLIARRASDTLFSLYFIQVWKETKAG